jgi:transcriptional regulator with XRE-family HTH domain
VVPPQLVKFPLSRRRTPGLRREEVAEMAGVSSSWYTWLEQGRNIQPSAEFLTRLAQVLQLNPYEAKHLFDLAGKNFPQELDTSHRDIPKSLEHLVMKVLNVPAVVVGEQFEYRLWNREYQRTIFDLSQLPRDRRTMLDVVFTQNAFAPDEPRRKEVAQLVVAEFRWLIGKQVGSPWVKALVDRMSKESSEFAQYWKSQEVKDPKKSRIVELQISKSKRKTFMRSVFVPVEAKNLRLVIFTPVSTKRK